MFSLHIFRNRNVASFTQSSKKLNLDPAPSASLYSVKESMAARTPYTNLAFRPKETKIHPLCPMHVVSGSSRIWCRKVYTLTSCSCVIPLPDNGRCLCEDKSLSTRNLVTSLAHSHVESGTTHSMFLFCRRFLCQIEKYGRHNVSTSEFLIVAQFSIMHSR
jgi:hypothetical protein